MTAVPELEEPTLPIPDAARKVAKSKLHWQADTVAGVSALYRHLDIRDLFNEFSGSLLRQVELGRVSLENHSLDIALDAGLNSNKAVDGDFMLRYLLEYEGETLGSLTVIRDRQFLSSEVRKVLASVNTLLGPLHNAIRYQRVWQSAYHDALTGVRNRAALDLLLSGEEQSQNVASLIFCDLDHFKSINDRFGHAVGDEVLREFARLLSVKIGRVGSVYRYGGDEFVVTLCRAQPDGGAQIAERIRQSVVDTAMVIDGQKISFTATIGLTAVGEQEALDEAFLRADSALLEGKRKNRNVVVCT